jgi:osmotically-inducible protein OsmY
MTDEDITTNIQTRFAGDTGLADQRIFVKTYERAVTLSGTVENETQRCIAIKLASRVRCVQSITSKIKIKRFF